jgi:hypothetical protein
MESCQNLREMLSPRLDCDRIPVDVHVPHLRACAKTGCSVCSIIEQGVDLFDHGWIAHREANREPYCLTIWAGKRMPLTLRWWMDATKANLQFYTHAGTRVLVVSLPQRNRT